MHKKYSQFKIIREVRTSFKYLLANPQYAVFEQQENFLVPNATQVLLPRGLSSLFKVTCKFWPIWPSQLQGTVRTAKLTTELLQRDSYFREDSTTSIKLKEEDLPRKTMPLPSVERVWLPLRGDYALESADCRSSWYCLCMSRLLSRSASSASSNCNQRFVHSISYKIIVTRETTSIADSQYILTANKNAQEILLGGFHVAVTVRSCLPSLSGHSTRPIRLADLHSPPHTGDQPEINVSFYYILNYILPGTWILESSSAQKLFGSLTRTASVPCRSLSVQLAGQPLVHLQDFVQL